MPVPVETLSVREPFVANQLFSHLVPEATAQTFDGNSFVQLDANGRAAAAPATPTDGTLLTNIGFVLEPGHNYPTNTMENLVEVCNRDTLIEITLTGVATQADLVPGKKYGLSIDNSTGRPIYVADRTKTTHGVVEFVRPAARGLLHNGKAVFTSGTVADTNVRIIVRITDAAGITS